MSTEEATYVIAHQEGLDLTKFLEPLMVRRVRSLIPRNSSLAVRARSVQKSKRSSIRTPVRIRLEGALPEVDAFMSSSVARDAKEMAKIYPIYYVLENSLRIVVRRIMDRKHGKEWWENRVSKRLRRKVSDRIEKEERKPWHGKRGQHKIFYSDFGDLRAIIERNWEDFKSLFPSRSWITQKLDELQHPRNILAHHNPVNKTDLKRIELYFHDWVELLKSHKDSIP
ncbi:MAG: Swt1 family HEPN domain-containing protein [Candidatus Neomarinimicrobiota bacterium]